jgi:outer membrane protein OmpA-like peptidoglycan-associated protein
MITATDALEPESCQIVADWLQYQRPITFAKESAELSESDLEQIEKLAASLKRCEATRVLIEGHTSKSGSDELNQELSEKRALAVRQALSDQGIAADRLTARGFGEAYPRFVTGADSDQNRRIELNLEWNDA